MDLEKKADAPGIEVGKNSDGSHNLGSAMDTIASIFGGSGKDETPMIKGPFLRKRGIKPKNIIPCVGQNGTVKYMGSYL